MTSHLNHQRREARPPAGGSRRGQALVEYALIVTLIVLAIVAILTLTGPFVANVFSNAVFNLTGQGTPTRQPLDATEFWRYVTAVASYTPQSRLVETNTPASDRTLTNTPRATFTPGPSVTPFTGTPKPPTAKPAATPIDRQMAYPFYDGGSSLSNWHVEFDNVIRGTALWTVEYFNNTTFTTPVAQTADLFWPADIDFTWTGSPAGGVGADGYSVRFKANIPLEATQYQIRVVASGITKVYIGGAELGGLSIPTDTGEQSRSIDYNATAGTQLMQIDFVDLTGEGKIQIVFNRLADKGDCAWYIDSSRYHSELTAFTDTVASNYAVNSVCHMRLRGWIPLPADRTARMVFWEQWKLNTQDDLQVGVREYGTADTWTWVTVNGPGVGENLNWRRREYDLANFGGSNKNYTGKNIEISFRVNSIDDFTEDGWYIDDIAVEDKTQREYAIPWKDDVDSDLESPRNWLNECNWRRTASSKYSGTNSWTDSPAGNYKDNDDCALQLNGYVNLESYPPAGGEVLELLFQSKATLTTVTDKIVVEYRELGTGPWTAFTPLGSAGPYVAQATTHDWKQFVVRLDPMKGKKFEMRFRLIADSDGNTADGWYIDDIELREKPIEVLNIPFYEPFDTAGRWITDGKWGLTEGAQPPFKSAPTALTDSPVGNYDANAESRAELIPALDLTGTTAPVMTFWTYWKASTANLYAEISKDDGVTWDATPLWRHLYSGSAYDDVAVQLGWQRIKINLSSYVGERIRLRFRIVVPGSTRDDGWYIDDLLVAEDDTDSYQLSTGPLVETMNGASAQDQWFNGGQWTVEENQGRTTTPGWVDSPNELDYLKPSRNVLEYRIRIDLRGTTKPTLYFWNRYQLNNNDGLRVEVSTDNGYTWSSVWDSSVAPVSNWVNLGWHRVQIDLVPYKPSDFVRIRFRLNALNTSSSAAGWYIDDFTVLDRAFLTDFGSSYSDAFNDFGNWVVEGNWSTAPNVYSGWEYQPAAFVSQPVTYTLGAQTVTTTNWLGDYWHVPSGTSAVWGTTPGTNVTWPTGNPDIGLDSSIGEVNFDYSTDTVSKPFPDTVSQWFKSGTNNHEWYLMRWRRRYRVSQAGSYMLRLRLAGGGRLYINGTLQTPRSDLPKPYRTQGATATAPWTVDPDERSHYYTYDFAAGTNYDLRVEYYHTTAGQSGPGKVEFSIAPRSAVARTSPNNEDYATYHRTSVILDGYLTIPANRVGNVVYDERWSFTDEDYGKVYYSLDEGFTWTEALTVRRSNNNPQGGGWSRISTQDWVNTSFLITDVGGTKFTTSKRVMVKFELDSGINAAVDDGWVIDNFQFVTTESVVNLPPTSTSATLLTTTNNNGSGNLVSFAPTVVDQPGDTHTFTIVGQPPRGTAGISAGDNELTYIPPAEWTGTTTFTYRATDQGGLSTVGTATVTVEPYFERGLNVGRNATAAPEVTINEDGISKTFGPWGTNSRQGSSTDVCGGPTQTAWLDSLQPPVPSGDARRNLLKCWRETSTGHISMSNVTSPAVYSFYVWVVEDEATPQTYDLYIDGTGDRMRAENSYNSGASGTWRKLGPYVVTFQSGSVPEMNYRVGTARVAAIEMWRGGDYQGPGWMTADQAADNANVNRGITVLNSADSVTISGGGSRIWNKTDEYRYAYRVETDDVILEAVTTFAAVPASATAKAGIMIRADDYEDARNISMFVRSDQKIAFQVRSSDGANTTETLTGAIVGTSSPIGVPVWLRLTKSGNNFTGEYSLNGTSWTTLGTTSVNVGNYYLVGTAVSAGVNSAGVFANAQFDYIKITQQ